MNEDLFSLERAKETLGKFWLPLNIIGCICLTTLFLINIYKIYKLIKGNKYESKQNKQSNL